MLTRVSTNIINHSNAANKFRTLLTAEREYNNDVDVIYRSLVDNERINFYTVHILAQYFDIDVSSSGASTAYRF